MSAAEFTFRFDKRSISAREGDTIASALHRSGVRVFTRSLKFHRPRGLYCGRGECPNCLMNVDGVPNVRTCITPAKEGMRVMPQNRFLSLGHDPAALLDHLFPRGFNHQRRLLRPSFAAPLYQRMVRRMMGTGQLPTGEFKAEKTEKLRPDVMIVGDDVASVSAARVLSRADVDLLLVRSRGISRVSPCVDPMVQDFLPPGLLKEAVDSILSAPRTTVLPAASVYGAYDEGIVLVASQGRAYAIRPRFILLAEEGRELPVRFRNWDLPGVMQEGAAKALLETGTAPGRRAVVTGTQPRAMLTAELLHKQGIAVAALVTHEADQEFYEPWMQRMLRIGWRVVEARGRVKVRSAVISQHDAVERIGCDCIITCGELAPRVELARQLGCSLGSHDGLPPNILADRRLETTRPGVFIAGFSAGITELDRAIRSGEAVARGIVGKLTGVG